MTHILRSSLFWALFVATLIFWVAVPFVPSDALFEFVISMTVAVGAGVIIGYLPGACLALVHQPYQGGQFLILGILGAWTALVGRQAWSYVFRQQGSPDWMLTHPMLAFIVWISVIGGFLHLLARGALDGNIPRTNWAFAVAVVIAGLVLFALVHVNLTI